MQAEDIMGQWLSGLSLHTQRSYLTAVAQFEAQTGSTWLTATAADVLAWRQAMQTAGLQRSTIGQRLTALSSLYAFASRQQPLVNPVRGAFRRRPRVARYANSQPLPATLAKRLLETCERQTVIGARNYALLNMAILLGWRVDEILRLRWRDLHAGAGELIMVDWSGKGDKAGLRRLPYQVYTPIRDYLQLAGRFPPAADDYIWRPLRETGVHNLKHVRTPLPANRPISAAQANNILRHALRHAGLTEQQARRFHFHSLRHTCAKAAYDGGMDLLAVSRMLNHESLDTTRIYLERLNEVSVDTSEAVAAGLGL